MCILCLECIYVFFIYIFWTAVNFHNEWLLKLILLYLILLVADKNSDTESLVFVFFQIFHNENSF